MKFLLLLLFVSAFSFAEQYETPECESLKTLWETKYIPELKVVGDNIALDEDCESVQASTAYAVDLLERYLPLHYRYLSESVKKLNFGGKGGKHTLAEAENESGTITVFDAVNEEIREFIAAHLVHEAAHLRKPEEDPDHVTCKKGELKGQKEACAETFTGELHGDAYNFTYVVLKEFYELSDEHEEINQRKVLREIRSLLRNNFNVVPKDIIQYWK